MQSHTCELQHVHVLHIVYNDVGALPYIWKKTEKNYYELPVFIYKSVQNLKK